MDTFSRIVLGYHGCDPAFAEALLLGRAHIADWQPSQNPYDWLGHGIYFWEFAPRRAKDWSDKGGVIGAVIQLGNCLDLMDVQYTTLLQDQYRLVQRIRSTSGQLMPKNKGKRRDLDCLIINHLVASGERKRITYQTFCFPYLEATEIYTGSGIFRDSHIQLAVRDHRCIVGVFRPNLS